MRYAAPLAWTLDTEFWISTRTYRKLKVYIFPLTSDIWPHPRLITGNNELAIIFVYIYQLHMLHTPDNDKMIFVDPVCCFKKENHESQIPNESI